MAAAHAFVPESFRPDFPLIAPYGSAKDGKCSERTKIDHYVLNSLEVIYFGEQYKKMQPSNLCITTNIKWGKYEKYCRQFSDDFKYVKTGKGLADRWDLLHQQPPVSAYLSHLVKPLGG